MKRQTAKEEIFTNPRPEIGCISSLYRVLEQLDHYKTFFSEQGSEWSLQMIPIATPHKMTANITANQENANQNSGEVLPHIY